VQVSVKPGRRSSFEVTFDGEILHSKLDTDEWPDTERVLEAIAKRLAR
jgi:selT/selW/selH-like putative selenoprotein